MMISSQIWLVIEEFWLDSASKLTFGLWLNLASFGDFPAKFGWICAGQVVEFNHHTRQKLVNM